MNLYRLSSRAILRKASDEMFQYRMNGHSCCNACLSSVNPAVSRRRNTSSACAGTNSGRSYRTSVRFIQAGHFNDAVTVATARPTPFARQKPIARDTMH
jgi:hypothetical protein